MSDKKLVVAVIDSGVNLTNEFLADKDIQLIKIETEEFNNNFNDINYHGTAVCSYICAECEDVKILSIQVLNKNNKGNLKKVISAIEYSINNNVDIINLSLGTCIIDERIDLLKEVCCKATEKGIVIFSAHNNNGKKAYPACFSNVISVDNHRKIEENFFYIEKKERNIVFSKRLININLLDEKTHNVGNSFLCAYLVGVFCSYIKHFKLDSRSKNVQEEFLDFMKHLHENYRDKIFNILEYETREKKAIVYPFNKKNQNDIKNYFTKFNIVGYCDIECSDQHLLDNKHLHIYNTIDEIVKKCDLLILGEMKNANEVDYIKTIIPILKKYDIDVFMKYGYVSTFNRYLFAKETGCNINCQHL